MSLSLRILFFSARCASSLVFLSPAPLSLSLSRYLRSPFFVLPSSRHPLSADFDLSSSHCRSRANFLHSSRSVLARSTFPSQLLRSGPSVVRARDVTLRSSCLFGEITRQHPVKLFVTTKNTRVIMSPLPVVLRRPRSISFAARVHARAAPTCCCAPSAVFTARLRLSRLITETGGRNIINIIPTAMLRRYIRAPSSRMSSSRLNGCKIRRDYISDALCISLFHPSPLLSSRLSFRPRLSFRS